MFSEIILDNFDTEYCWSVVNFFKFFATSFVDNSFVP